MANVHITCGSFVAGWWRHITRLRHEEMRLIWKMEKDWKKEKDKEGAPAGVYWGRLCLGKEKENTSICQYMPRG